MECTHYTYIDFNLKVIVGACELSVNLKISILKLSHWTWGGRGVPKYEYDLLLLLVATCKSRYSQGFYVLCCQQKSRPIIIIQNGDFICSIKEN